jgi:diadenosine tetraphosphatase ApaH/serine/threonine PP2A family protein phosphatase
VLGNHDAGVIGKTDIMFFNSPAQTAITWQQDRIQENELAYLTELPYSVIADSIRFVHSSPREPEQWKYIISWYDAMDEFPYFSEKLCFIGHSHIPCIFSEDGITPASEGTFELDRNTKYIINVGSIGQPRDGDPRLSFGIFDKDTYTIEIIRLNYDIKTARQKIITSNLPKVLGDRLLFGH